MAKAGRQEITKARLNLQTERTRLKEEQISLTREWEKLNRAKERISRERADALAYLRRLCERFGDNDWPDDLPLAEILEIHLADPLADSMGRLRRQFERLQADLRRAETQPVRPLAVIEGRALPARTARVPEPAPAPPPEEVTRVLKIPSQRGQDSYQAVCSCRWAGAHRLREEIAELDRSGHYRTHTHPRQAGAGR